MAEYPLKPDKSKTYSNTAIEAEAIAIVQNERKQWHDAVAFVTDKVAFQMRNLIRNLRKNYWGVYDVPMDPLTGRQKVWVPLTRVLVEGIVKNIDLDAKDINFRSKNPKGYESTSLIRALVHDYLERTYFGEALDEMERTLAIDGTAVWKTIEGTDEDGKPTVVRKNVDLLNIYIDPTEDNIQSAFRFTERGLMLPVEFESMDGWMNTKNLSGSQMISRIDGQYQPTSTGTTAKYRDVWEMWGKIPKSLITGKKEDKDELIDGHIVVSGLEGTSPACHLIEENIKKIKPYEEVRYAKVANRWYGLGIAERVLMLQMWINTIINIRINRSYVSQLGLFKIRKGAGITPQMLSRLGANGAIVVNDPADIEQMQMQEASPASYQDEQRIIDWAQRDTSATDISVGEPTPASKPATTSVIENNNAKSSFTMVKEAIGSFLQRWVNRHALPIIAKTATVKDLIRISTSEDAIHKIIDTIIAKDLDEALDEMWAHGIIPSQESMQAEVEKAKKQILGRDNVFIKVVKNIIAEHVDTQVFITNEDMDVSVTVQNLMQMMQVAPELRIPLIKEAMDLMGLDIELPKPQPQSPHERVSMSMNFKDLPPDGQAQMAQEAGIQLNQKQQLQGASQGGMISKMNPQQINTKANTLQSNLTGVR